MWRITGRAKKEDEQVEIVKEFVTKVIQQRRESRHNTKNDDKGTGGLFLDVLLDGKDSTGSPLTDDHICGETITGVTAARDTSTRSTIFTLFMLCAHPKEYAKVMAELDDFLSSNGGDLNKIGLNDLKHLECCFNETIRFYPPVFHYARKLKQELKLDNGIVVPKDATCTVVSLLVHRDPAFFPDPDTFKPERFMEEIDPYAYIAFSAGRRSCVGQKFAITAVKTLLAKILMSFTISSDRKMEDVKFTMDILLKPIEPILFKLTTRTKID